MKYSQESSLETVYQEMLDSIYKAAKQKLICLLDQKWFFKGSVTYPDLHNINFELKYCGDEEEYFITGICGIRNGVSLSKIILKCDISNGIDSKYTKFEVEYDERKYLDDIEKNINAILKNNRSYKYFCEDYERYTRQNPFQYVRELIKSHSFEIEKEVDPGPGWMNYYYTGEYGEDSLKIYIDNSEFGYDDNEEPPFDYFCVDVGDRFQLSLYEVDSAPIRELFLLIERSNISIENFLIRTTAMHCIKQDHHIHRIIQEIKKHNVKAGIAINPGTPINNLKEVLPLVDLVLVMGVNPGFGGQAFIENTLNRIKELSVIKKEKSFNFDINVDGGIKSSNYMKVLECGANNVIIGSDLFKDNEITNNISKFR